MSKVTEVIKTMAFNPSLWQLRMRYMGLMDDTRKCGGTGREKRGQRRSGYHGNEQ